MSRFNEPEIRGMSEFMPLEDVIEGAKDSVARGGNGFLGVAELDAEIPVYLDFYRQDFSAEINRAPLLVSPLNARNQNLYGFEPGRASRVHFRIMTRYASEEG